MKLVDDFVKTNNSWIGFPGNICEVLFEHQGGMFGMGNPANPMQTEYPQNVIQVYSRRGNFTQCRQEAPWLLGNDVGQ